MSRQQVSRATRRMKSSAIGILGVSFLLVSRSRAFTTTTAANRAAAASRYSISALSVAGKEVEEKVDDKSTSGTHGSQSGRFDSLLDSVGLAGKLIHAQDLPAQRTVTPHDVFCNRELKMSGIRAIGFDMDYTLAQYQQPAFDKLAFDGAKEKLVYKLGYPKEVLDFEYDHEVRCCVFFIIARVNFLIFIFDA